MGEYIPFTFADGQTYDHRRDYERLAKQHRAVFITMIEARSSLSDWRTIEEIKAQLRNKHEIHATSQSISARLRDLRKYRFGLHIVDKRYIDNGLFIYRVVPAHTAEWNARWRELEAEHSGPTAIRQARAAMREWIRTWGHLVQEIPRSVTVGNVTVVMKRND